MTKKEEITKIIEDIIYINDAHGRADACCEYEKEEDYIFDVLDEYINKVSNKYNLKDDSRYKQVEKVNKEGIRLILEMI